MYFLPGSLTLRLELLKKQNNFFITFNYCQNLKKVALSFLILAKWNILHYILAFIFQVCFGNLTFWETGGWRLGVVFCKRFFSFVLSLFFSKIFMRLKKLKGISTFCFSYFVSFMRIIYLNPSVTYLSSFYTFGEYKVIYLQHD